MKCSQYAYNRKVLGIPTPSGIPAAKGNEFHRVIDKLIKGSSESEVRKNIKFEDVGRWLTLFMVNRGLSEFTNATSEEKIFAGKALNVVSKDVADFMGIIDVIWQKDNIVHILDWKTGGYEYDNPIERNWYAALAKAKYPWAKTVMFELYYVRTNRKLESTYLWGAKENVLCVKDPSREIDVQNKHDNPLRIWVKEQCQNVELSDPIPNVGPHCRNWYGSPCFYLAEHCPAYKNSRKIRSKKNEVFE